MKNIFKCYAFWACAIITVILGGCSQEEIHDSSIDNNAGLSLSMVADDLVPGELKTRVGSRVVKDNEEMEIKTMHVFIFGSDGNYLQSNENARYQGYTYLSGTTMLRIDKEGFSNPEFADDATVCVVANVESGTFNLSGDTPKEIQNLTDFRNFVYTPKNYKGMLFNLPDEGMPMLAIKEGVKLISSSGTIDIELKALMARIDVNLSVSNSESQTELPSIILKNVKMYNMAQGVPFTMPDGYNEQGELNETPTDVNVKDSENVQPGGTSIIYNHQSGKALTFYVFENIRDDNGKDDSVVYPTNDENFKDEYKQRYKPLFAKETATYASFDCQFTSYNGLTYDVSYNLYFGGDNIKDFKIKRNSIYTNNVLIKGLTQVGDSEEKFIFDARVNVSTATNAYFVSCLRERELDAHFNVFPMDIYVMEAGSHVKLEILDPTTTDWIRMERIPAANMSEGSVPEYLQGKAYASGNAYTAGNGKRNFFTEDLLQTLKSKFDMYHRDRVYFYVDEFISVEEMRQAIIRISLINAEGETKESYDVEFDQYGLLEVKYIKDGDKDYTYIYMERFEEYLNFTDPLDQFSSDYVYSGLPWGPDGETGLDRNNYYNGITVTSQIVDKFKDAPTLNKVPVTAAGYCWNKNMRSDENGNINNLSWFLPGIRQLENCLTQHYDKFPEFRGYYYWASSVAKKYGVWILGPIFGGDNDNLNLGTEEGEAQGYARATAVKGFDSDGNAVYAGSDRTGRFGDYTWDNYEDGNGGRAKRNTSLRIRACYQIGNGEKIN